VQRRRLGAFGASRVIGRRRIIGVEFEGCRKAEIMADAAHAVLACQSAACSGNFLIDEAVRAAEGVNDFERYAVLPGSTLVKDLFAIGDVTKAQGVPEWMQ
jgi:hypothetical protein